MTTVEIARARLAQVAARRATPKRRTATTSPRHDDSGAQSALEGASESVLARSMTTTADALPDDIGALRALILVERAERDVQRLTGHRERRRIQRAVNGVGREQPAEEHDLGDQKDPHAHRRRVALLLGVVELMRARRAGSVLIRD